MTDELSYHTTDVEDALIAGLKQVSDDARLSMPSATAAKTVEFLTRARQALASDAVPDLATFNDQERSHYESLLSQGNLQQDALKLAPLMAQALNDQDVRIGLMHGRRPWNRRPAS